MNDKSQECGNSPTQVQEDKIEQESDTVLGILEEMEHAVHVLQYVQKTYLKIQEVKTPTFHEKHVQERLLAELHIHEIMAIGHIKQGLKNIGFP